MTRRALSLLLVLAVGVGACADGPSSGPRVGLTAEDDSTTTEASAPDLEPCRMPHTIPDGADPRLVTLRARIVDLLADMVALSDAIEAATFEPDWAVSAPVGAEIYAMQSSLYALVATLEGMFRAAGATATADGWTFGDDAVLAPFAGPWAAVLVFQAVTFPALVTASDRSTAIAMLADGALCDLVDGFSDALPS